MRMVTRKREKLAQVECTSGNNLLLWLVFVLLAILTMFPHLQTGFTTQDDTLIALEAQDPGTIIKELQRAAKIQGRFFLVIWYLLAEIPYQFHNLVYYQSFRIVPILLNLILFVFVIRVFFKSFSFAFFSAILAWCFLQNHWHYNLLTAYPFVFQIGLSGLFLSLLFFAKHIETRKVKWSILSGFFFFLSMLTYEAFVPYTVVFIGLALCAELKERNYLKYHLIRIFHLFLPILISVGIYLTAYLTFRHFYPGSYAGPKLDLSSLTEVIRVIWHYSISTLPTYFYWIDKHIIKSLFDGFTPYSAGTIPLLKQMRVEWLVKGIIAFSACWMILQCEKRFLFNRSSFIITMIFGLALIILPVSLLGLSPKYQWWSKHGSLAHVPSFFSFFGTILMIGSVLFLINQMSRRWKITKTICALFSAVMIFSACLVTDYYNYYVALDQQSSQLTWTTFDLFLKTPEFKAIPDKSMIYAPTLWNRRGMGSDYTWYWSSYIKNYTEKVVTVTKDSDELKQFLEKSGVDNVYFLSFQQEPKDKNQFVVFSKVDKTIGKTHILSKEVTLFTYSKNRKFTLNGTFKRKDSGANILINGTVVNNLDARTFSFQVNNTMNLDNFPKTTIKSNVFLEPGNMSISFFPIGLQLSPVQIEFGSGFYRREKNRHGNTWNWSKGNAEIILTNLDLKPLKRYLNFKLISLLPRYVSMVVNNHVTETQLKSGKRYFNHNINSLGIELKPGENHVHFQTDVPAQFPGNRDTRKIAFGVYNFRVTENPI